MREICPPLASDSFACTPSFRTYFDEINPLPGSGRGSSARPRSRHDLSYPATSQWTFLTSTLELVKNRRQNRPVPPSRPSSARKAADDTKQLPRRPATSRGIRSQTRHHEKVERGIPKSVTVTIHEAGQIQEQCVELLTGRSGELRGQPGQDGEDKAETKPIEPASRARVVKTVSMNAGERLLLRALQTRANVDYDRAIKLYTCLSAARPNDIERKFRLAVCLERAGQFASALAAYKQVQELSGGQHAFAYYNMGNLCIVADKAPQAIRYFSCAIAASNENSCKSLQILGPTIRSIPVVFYRQRAAAYRKNGDFEKAAQDYDLAQRYASVGSPTMLRDTKLMYTVGRLNSTIKRAVFAKKTKPQESAKSDENEILRDS